jgi:outer membrane biosynthesis protein TonB
MTRYSRSVIPGRPAEESDHNPNLDRMIFGAKRKPPVAANDRAAPDFLAPVDQEEADILASRADLDRRKSSDRRGQAAGRRASEYAPLRDGPRPPRQGDSKRGPLLLGGALLIVAVFGVVVWTAYSDGLASDEVEVTPELNTAGAFKTPPRMVEAAPAAVSPDEAVPEPGNALSLDGGATDSLAEERPETPAPADAVVAPPPSKVMAPPPAPLKSPAPVAAAVAPPPARVEPAKGQPPQVQVTKPAPPNPVASALAPAPLAAGPTAYRPAFAAYGDHVVQIAATSSTASADAEWARMSKTWPDLLSGAERFVQQADVNGKTVYRLRVGSFASKADAAAFCTVFKAKGGNCYPAVK